MNIRNINVQAPDLGVATPSFTVPAIAYLSGERLWYAVTLPYKTLGRFVQTSAVKKKNEVIIKSEIKNRFLDKVHKNEIKNYIVEESRFTIPPITLVSYDELNFEPFVFGSTKQIKTKEELMSTLESCGSLAGMMQLPVDYEFECLDGNHRTVAIRELAQETPELIANSNMLLNIVYEKDRRKIRQDFVDVNKNAKQTTPSINTLFNTRDPLSRIVMDILESSDYLEDITELLSTSVSKNSKDIYTLNNIKNVIIELGGKNSQSGKSGEKAIIDKLKEDDKFSVTLKYKGELFFKALKENQFIKQCLIQRDKTPELKYDSVITSGVGLIVASRVAKSIFDEYEQLRKDHLELSILEGAYNSLELLMLFDWSRSNSFFKGKLVSEESDKLITSRETIQITSEALKGYLGYNKPTYQS
ncbi:TPA: DNA sulfur modification protein DndB [Bacillus paranthracis]|uniref:DNA sulfur modification protein DndB n=1 Tax=Bacillus paranthracis TaxID=2026186 RepID=UPI00298C6D5A|nr:DNA sulfur modification protein DndB [Bacillus paranthracis]HDR7276600.1 DNA sulfur modification protein DndB [Bacillus paranthracis]HDR7306530.1 DNA sulfur modification protein DndB [Bacillus paranthracis]